MESREGGGAEVGGKCVGLLSSRPVYLVRAGTEEIGGQVAATWRQNGGDAIPELSITCGNGLINVRVCITWEKLDGCRSIQ